MHEQYRQRSIPALKVRQWLNDWDNIHWDPSERQAKPEAWFYTFSLSAADLRSLSGIYARSTENRARASEDLGIQRSHERGRSDEIGRFVRYGYPLSTLGERKRKSDQFQDLRKPGWLPTSIVVNILTGSDRRLGNQVAPHDLIKITDGDDGIAELVLPICDNGWKPEKLPPIEVIDGQHRLWAFQDGHPDENYELPVVAFVGLDLSWQAYLFYTINIKPKKINASLAYDLYPLLRHEEWLTRFDGHVIYRETRAQELVDLLWSCRKSPWYRRINMLGESGSRGLKVTQASWVRSLLASFVKSWNPHRIQIGGLFGSAVGEHRTVLRWTRIEQAAFLIVVGQEIEKAIARLDEPWMQALRREKIQSRLENDDDWAFVGQGNLLNADQGIRAILQVVNDVLYIRADELQLHCWGGDQGTIGADLGDIDECILSLRDQSKIIDLLTQLATALAKYDWRSSKGPDLTDEESVRKAAFRGSGGYKELRRDVLHHLSEDESDIACTAREVIHRLGY